jgi:hypothetical protein
MIAVTNSNSTNVNPHGSRRRAASVIGDRLEHPGNAGAAKADFRSVVEAAPKAFGAAIWAKVDLIFTRTELGLVFMSDMILQI